MNAPDLVTRAKAGDEAAFTALVERHGPLVNYLAASYVGSRDAPDAAQEVWLAVHRKLWQLESEELFRPWLRKVVFYHCLNFRKGRARRRPELYLNHSDWDRVAEYLSDDRTSVEELLDRRELRREVARQLRLLPGEYGLILELYYLKELSVSQIAEQTSLTNTTVKWRLHQGRKLLKSKLASTFHERGPIRHVYHG